MRISVFGLGKLGSPLAAVLADAGHDVIGVDVNQEYVRKLNAGEAPVEETGLAKLLAKNRERLSATTWGTDAARHSEAIFIVVPTPSLDDGSFSNAHVFKAVGVIGEGMARDKRWRLVVLVSTVMPGSCHAIVGALEAASQKKCGEDFGFCYNPEFVALGSVIRDMKNPDFVLIGESDARAGAVLESLYVSVCGDDVRVARMNYINAEIAKLALNCYVTMKISYANMLAGLCEQLPGADAHEVAGAIGLDSRIGGKYLMPGAAYGGTCFPRDNRAFQLVATGANVPADLSVATVDINHWTNARLVEEAWHRCGGQGKVAVLGLAYKPHTNVAEESAGVAVANALHGRGVPVMAHDPKALPDAMPRLRIDMGLAHTMRACVKDAVVILVMTAWPEFAELDGSMLADDPRPTVIDCWGIVDPEKLGDGVDYRLIGRA